MPQRSEIVRMHGKMVWGTICRLVGTTARQSDVEDCFQEVFVAALEFASREEVRNWEALLRRIATVKGLDLLRARVRRRERDAAGTEVDLLEGRSVTGEEVAMQSEAVHLLRSALGRLSPEEAELFCLRHLEEMSYEEIGRVRSMTGGAVGVALHRLKEKLRAILSETRGAR